MIDFLSAGSGSAASFSSESLSGGSVSEVTPPPAPLVAVDRAVAELRRGGLVMIVSGSDAQPLLIQAAEAVSDASLARIERLAGGPARLFVTGRRAKVLGLLKDAPDGSSAEIFSSTFPLTAEAVAIFCDPEAKADLPALQPGSSASLLGTGEAAILGAIALAKTARLLPAAVGTRVEVGADIRGWAAERNILTVDAAAVVTYQQTAARSLRVVSEARVPLIGAEQARIVVFRPGDGGIEHLAIVIGEPDPEQPVLIRLHSECFTGDLLGSLRCDCGDQLRGAIANIGEEGNGILLYLSQEGRGIGLVNKLRAYRLQDDGFDTMDANGQLGFDDDERIYLPAAEMLRQLGVTRVRLMTNNPQKVAALGRYGVQVEERVPHVFVPNPHSLAYLRTKAVKGGHLF